MGDIGQYKIFLKNKKTKLFHPDNYVSTVREVCEKFNIKHKNQMANNFERVFKNIKTLKNIDESVVLGDVVYPEVRSLGTKSKYNHNKNQYSWKYKEYLAEYIYRLHCGWLYLVDLLKNPKNPKFIREMRMIFGNHSYDVNYKTEAYYIANFFKLNDALLANSTGGIREVENLNERQVLYPKIVRANSPDMAIYYIDIDPSQLQCSNYSYKITKVGKEIKYTQFKSPKEFRKDPIYAKFTNCLETKWSTADPGMEYMTSRKLNRYLRYLRHLLTLLENVDQDADWRIVRMHQPIFNVEIDFDGMKRNKMLMQAFKKAHIHLWFVAHNHTAQIDIGLYEDKNYKYLPHHITGGHGFRKDEPSGVHGGKVDRVCIGNRDPYWDKNFKLYRKITVTCVNRARAWLRHHKSHKGKGPKQKFSKFAKMFVSAQNEDLIIQTLVGFSGRKPDPLFSDKFSDGSMLWGHTDVKSFGYAIAKFYISNNKLAVKVTYYANKNNGSHFNKLFTLKVVQVDKPLTRKQVLKKNFRIDFMNVLKNKYHEPKK